MSNQELKTSAEWQEEIPNPKIINPDGWDRENFKHSWSEEKISKEEYLRRSAKSTVYKRKDD